jgi:phage host-nuclease inhibitor protein Gam
MARYKTKAASAPQTLADAIAQLERFAVITAQLQGLRAHQDEAIAQIRAACDQSCTPMELQLKSIAAELKIWWAVAKDQVTKGQRKSAYLGGCEIGERLGTPSLKLLKHLTEQDVIDIIEQLHTPEHGDLIRTIKTMDKQALIALLRFAPDPNEPLVEALIDAGATITQINRFFVDVIPPKSHSDVLIPDGEPALGEAE